MHSFIHSFILVFFFVLYLLCLPQPTNHSRHAKHGEALLDAAEAGSCAEIRRLLAARADVEYRDAEGFTPLIFAACNGWAEAVRVLLREGGADLRWV